MGKCRFLMCYPLMALFSLDMKKKERYFVYKGNRPEMLKANIMAVLLVMGN